MYFRSRYFLFAWFVLSMFFRPQLLPAQTVRALEKAGDKAMAEKDYYRAFTHFRDAMAQAPDDVSLWFKYAEVARQFNAFEEAEKYYAKVWQGKQSAAFPMAGFWLGQVKKCLGKYQEASEVFEAFLKNSGEQGYFSEWANAELAACKSAVADPGKQPDGVLVEVEHLDKKINTPYSEFGAVEAGETIYYSSFRFDFPGDRHLPVRKLTKVLTSQKLAKGKPMAKGFNEEAKHTAHTAFSLDGSRIYFTVCEYVTSSDIRCTIAFKEKDKRGNWEKKSVPLPEIVNLKGYTATQPAIGFDSVLNKEVLYFASDRPGGKGKLDLWFCELEKGKFLNPQPLEALNTPENDIAPFFHTASQTLYFSSDGRAGLGGYDIYFSEQKNGFAPPGGLPKPINSSYHDIYYSLNDAGKAGFLSSNRPGSFYLDPSNKACCHDIYRVVFREQPKDSLGIPPPVASIPLLPPGPPPVPTKLEDFLPLALYFDNDEPDKRTTRTTTKKTYTATFEKYYDRKRNYISEYQKPLDEEKAEEAGLAMEDFFEGEVKKGFDHLQLFSEILLNRLDQGDRVEIVIKGYTSPRAKSEYNDNLAQRRISSLRNEFLNYRGGVFESYLKHGKLLVSEAPFGETQADTQVSDDLFDERNSIYSIGAARERRVEIVEVK